MCPCNPAFRGTLLTPAFSRVGFEGNQASPELGHKNEA